MVSDCAGVMRERFFKGCNLELSSEVVLTPGSSVFEFVDVVTNRGSETEEFQMLYHANFGSPLLEKGSQVHGTVKKVIGFDQGAADKIKSWDQYE